MERFTQSWQYSWRLAACAAICFALVVLYFWNPETRPMGISTHMLKSVVGIPCPFCGVTRGTHWLLQGDLTRAAYFNLISYLVVFGGIGMVILWSAELMTRRVIVQLNFWLLKGVRYWKWALMLVFLYWVMHIGLAKVYQKEELLNRNAPLFPDSLF